MAEHWRNVLILPIVAVALSVSAETVERPYAFREELETVHERGIRDRNVVRAADEFAFADGAVISVPFGHDLIFRAAQDFADYLAVSQDVSVRVAPDADCAALTIWLEDALDDRSYEVRVGGKGVGVAASDDRAAAQALYHLEDLMNLSRSPFLRHGTERRKAKYSPRMIHSGWGIDTFPENYLRRAAHSGFDAILVFVKEAGRTARGWDDVNTIIRTAKRWGIDTYLYSYVHAPVHPDDPKASTVFRDSFGAIARAYPDARGYIFVGESCHFPSKDPRTNGKAWPDKPEPGDARPYPGSYPCSDYPDWLKGVKAAIDRESPGADIVFWTYNFGDKPEDVRLELLRKMPRDVSLLITFEMFEGSVKRNGMRSRVWDYSISDPGPGRYYVSEAAECGRAGLHHYAMANTAGLTWDMGTVPYLPCPFQWKRRWEMLEESRRTRGLAGLMESHHYGWYPSFVTELSKESFTEGGMPFDEHLRKIATRDFGPENAEEAIAAWRGLSEAIADAYPCPQNLAGPYRIGPAFPYDFGGKRIEYADVPFPQASPYLAFYCWTYFNYMEDFAKSREPPVVKSDWEPDQMKLEVELLADMVRKADAAADAFAAMMPKLDGRRSAKAGRAADLARYMARTWTTVSHLRQGALATLAGNEAEVRRIAEREYANKRATLELVDRNSRLGWEPSMDYMGGRKVIEWSMGLMERTYGIGRGK